MSDEERAELEAMRAREAQWEAHLDAQVHGCLWHIPLPARALRLLPSLYNSGGCVRLIIS